MPDTLETYRTITPYLVVRDAEAEIKFMSQAFGATEVQCHRRDDNTIQHAEVKTGDSLIMLGQSNEKCEAMKSALYLWIADVDAIYAKALAAGATSQMAPADQEYGHRTAGVIDPNGITWWIGSPMSQATS